MAPAADRAWGTTVCDRKLSFTAAEYSFPSHTVTPGPSGPEAREGGCKAVTPADASTAVPRSRLCGVVTGGDVGVTVVPPEPPRPSPRAAHDN